MSTPDLSVDFCGLCLPNPLILASGGLGESADTLIPFLQAGASAVVTRTLRLQVDPERRVFPSPHLIIGPQSQYMMNCEWGNIVSWDYWLERGLPQLREQGLVIISLSGRNVDDCVALAEQFDRVGVPLLEINVSCSHSGFLYRRITDDAKHISRLISTLKRKIKALVMIKLGWSPILPDIAKIAVAAGADAISTTNSIGPGLDVRLEDGRPELGIYQGVGGLSGQAIFPIALQCVHSVVEAVEVPVMGIGGISSYREVIKMLMVGATCVQLYTEAYLRGPQIFSTILGDVATYLSEHNHDSLQSIKCISLPYLRSKSNLDPVIPSIASEKCSACGICERVCRINAISIKQVAEIDVDKCTGCGACFHICPPTFNAISRL